MKKSVTVVFPEQLGRVAPEIFGQFSEHIGGVFYGGLWVGKDSKVPNLRGFRKDAIEKLRALHVPVLRWPGGCFAEVYNWRDGIGENRPTRVNWWTRNDGRYESNAVGTHEFVDLCELIGAKPYFAVNVTSMTPMDMRDWMDYCLSPRGTTTLALEREKNGHPEPFDIPYWGIGNENWGGGGNMSPESYAMEYRRYATILENVSQGKVELFAGGANADDYDWTQGLTLTLCSKYGIPKNGMSFHYYCGKSGDCVNYTEENWDELVKAAARMEELVERHHAIVKGRGLEKDLPLVVDEWGCWHPEGSGPSKGYNLFEQQSTLRDAVISMLTLNIFVNHAPVMKMANAAQICNNLHCCLLADAEHCITTPTYHVFAMTQGHMGGAALRTLVPDNDDIVTGISAAASVKDGMLTVSLANLSCREDAEIDLTLLGAELPETATLTMLTADDMRAHNTFEAPDAVTPQEITVCTGKTLVLPKASAAVLSCRL